MILGQFDNYQYPSFKESNKVGALTHTEEDDKFP